jgi:DNA-binding NtrC family response regulator
MVWKYPGNEAYIIKRAVLLESTDIISPTALDLPKPKIKPESDESQFQNMISQIIQDGTTLHDIEVSIINNAEKKIISEILKEVHYNKSKAAKLLGIDRNTLYSKIKFLHINQ